FLGIDDISFVRAEGVAYSPQHRADALASALAGLGEEEEAAVSA
ncbi:FMN-dependent NADH-azoreductase, partial [Xanthomonas perforans]|nr:FMN-dependent NADH-azoreductase [Xanthomonas perforans]